MRNMQKEGLCDNCICGYCFQYNYLYVEIIINNVLHNMFANPNTPVIDLSIAIDI